MIYLKNKDTLIKKGITKLLEIKDSDIRLLNLYQCRYAVDKAIHIGGASSAVIPMVSLFYGGIIDLNISQPTAIDQDIFVLSKGHAVATLASIYSDLGYFDRALLKNSRSILSPLNGHPGPLLPGVHIATGPMGQGMGVAQGFAIAGQRTKAFDVYALTGDGELQEGSIWESVMYAGQQKLENLCVMVDSNGGQLDIVSSLHFPFNSLAKSFASFNWRVFEVDATQYTMVHSALSAFKHEKRDGRPTVIICNTTKGYGSFSSYMNNHKVSISEDLLDQESEIHSRVRDQREKQFSEFVNSLHGKKPFADILQILKEHARSMGLKIEDKDNGISKVKSISSPVATQKASIRDKAISYSEEKLPILEKGKAYAAHSIIESAMKVFAKDERVFSIDSDLASTSGLQGGVGFVDKTRALNVGVAEANMMLIGEAFAVLGGNVWISTFCPFYDWKVLRRIAVGHQERLEVIRDKGWLSEGHGIDLTMLATAADLETQSNGATHMGNDDALLLNEAAHVKILTISCPQLLLSALKWVMEGNRGIVYMRILRAAATTLYDRQLKFEYNKAYLVKKENKALAVIVSSGRGVHEALMAADILKSRNLAIEVVDMPSVDEEMIMELYQSGKTIFIAEQNNGFLWTNFQKVLFMKLNSINREKLIPLNTSCRDGLHYIHSGTYLELVKHYRLDAESLSEQIINHLK